MPMYAFVCERGHQTERFFHMNDEKPGGIECDLCGDPATRSFASAPAVIPDFPEHYNWSLGCVVKNRAHHKELQKRNGLQDWEPIKNSPGSQLSAERMRR